MNTVKIGWGEKNLCPTGGAVYIAGNVPFRPTDMIHDDIKATAMVIKTEDKRIIWVSCDFCHPTKQIEDRVISLLKECVDNFSENELIISGTHATACFYLSDNEILDSGHLLGKSDNLIPLSQAREEFCQNIKDAVLEALANMEYQDMEYTSVYIPAGFCRRAVYKDGSAVMYGNVRRYDFKEMEYPDGGNTNIIYFYEKGTRNIKAILAATPCPAQADEGSCYITADYWGYTRQIIKSHYGENTKLFALCRAAGELSPHRLFADDVSKETSADRARELGESIAKHLICCENKPKTAEIVEDIDFDTVEICFPAREISDELYNWAKKYRENKANYTPEGKALSWDTDSNARHIVKFKENNITSYNAKISVIKIGSLVFFTAPLELFTEYSKRIINQFNNINIFDIQLTHDSIGYLPTKEAIAHGGYSTHHFSALCDEIGGEVYVRKIIEMIRSKL